MHTHTGQVILRFSWCVVAEEILKEMVGPGVKDQWLYWKSQSTTQQRRQAVVKELEKLLNSNEVSHAYFQISG